MCGCLHSDSDNDDRFPPQSSHTFSFELIGSGFQTAPDKSSVPLLLHCICLFQQMKCTANEASAARCQLLPAVLF